MCFSGSSDWGLKWLTIMAINSDGHKQWRLQLSLSWFVAVIGCGHHCQGFCGSLKVLEFFSRFSRPGKSLKTDMVLERPWICVWRSLKVLEFDFLKRRDRTSWYWKRCSIWLLSDLKCASNPFSAGLCPGPRWVSLRHLYMLIKVPVWCNLVLLIYPSYDPWKSLISPWMWFWQMCKNPALFKLMWFTLGMLSKVWKFELWITLLSLNFEF